MGIVQHLIFAVTTGQDHRNAGNCFKFIRIASDIDLLCGKLRLESTHHTLSFFPEQFDLDHTQISRSKWSTLALRKIQEYFRKNDANGAILIISVSRKYLLIASTEGLGNVVDSN